MARRRCSVGCVPHFFPPPNLDAPILLLCLSGVGVCVSHACRHEAEKKKYEKKSAAAVFNVFTSTFFSCDYV